MMEERLTTLEAKSDSNAATLAALENDMNDRFNRIETELSELRQGKADSESTLYRLGNLQEEMARRFGEMRADIELRFELLRSAQERDFKKNSDDSAASTALIREDMDRRFDKAETEMHRRFVELREEMNRRFSQLQEEMNRRFGEQQEEMNRRFGELRQEIDRRFAELREDVTRRFIELRNEMNSRFNQVDAHFDQVEARLDRIESTVKETNTFIRWMLGSQAVILLAILGMAAKLITG